MTLLELSPEARDSEAATYEDDPYFTDPHFAALCDSPEASEPDDPDLRRYVSEWEVATS